MHAHLGMYLVGASEICRFAQMFLGAVVRNGAYRVSSSKTVLTKVLRMKHHRGPWYVSHLRGRCGLRINRLGAP